MIRELARSLAAAAARAKELTDRALRAYLVWPNNVARPIRCPNFGPMLPLLQRHHYKGVRLMRRRRQASELRQLPAMQMMANASRRR